MPASSSRDAVVQETLTWLSTPFHHAARIKGVGVDCAQLLIAVYHAAGLTPDIDPGYYAQDWFLHERRERIIEIVEQFMVPTSTPDCGDVALFRYGRSVSHAAIIVEWPEVIHAYRGRAVCFDRADIAGSMFGRFVGAWTPRQWVADA